VGTLAMPYSISDGIWFAAQRDVRAPSRGVVGHLRGSFSSHWARNACGATRLLPQSIINCSVLSLSLA
jgi:hypothetical protein